MSLVRFVTFTAAGAGIWCAILTYLGWLIGRHGEAVDRAIGPHVHQVFVQYILPALVVIVVGYMLWRRGQRKVAQ
jgi:membrane protein DedA with SNARE-associated domain